MLDTFAKKERPERKREREGGMEERRKEKNFNLKSHMIHKKINKLDFSKIKQFILENQDSH